MKRVTGIGGVFFKSKSDVTSLNKWYEKHLGIDYVGSEGHPFWTWQKMSGNSEPGVTAWSIFSKDSNYFGREDQQFMFNFRVEDLVEFIALLKSEGVQVVGEIQEFSYGKFCWIIDPDGNRIELWEPAEQTGFTGGMPME